MDLRDGWAGREVGAEEERVAGLELGAKADEDVAGLCGGEVADAGADVEREDAGVGRSRSMRTAVGDVVGDLAADGDAGDGALDLVACFVERGGADVDGLVEDGGLAVTEGAEKDAGLGGGAGAEFGDGEIGRTEVERMISSAWAAKRSRSVRVR